MNDLLAPFATNPLDLVQKKTEEPIIWSLHHSRIVQYSTSNMKSINLKQMAEQSKSSNNHSTSNTCTHILHRFNNR